MSRLITASGMRAADEAAIKRFKIPGIRLMERAGAAVAKEVLKELGKGARGKRAAIFAGAGNNGGDGFVAAKVLKKTGIEADVFFIGREEKLKGDARLAFIAWKKAGGSVYRITAQKELKDVSLRAGRSAIIVDALFGTGLKSNLTGVFKAAVELVNRLGKKVVSVDVPSGVDATTGKILGASIKADVTVTFAAAKPGLYIYPGRERAGRVKVADIGIPDAAFCKESPAWELIDAKAALAALPERKRDSHKGSYGHVLVIGGSIGKTGAACMAAIGAMRIGAGLATVAGPKSLNAVIEAKTLEAMTLQLPEESKGFLGSRSTAAAVRAIEGKSAVIIGPGLGSKAGVRFIEKLAAACSKNNTPLVIDADGLNALGKNAATLKKFSAKLQVVITPHPGEAGRLLGIKTAAVTNDRIGAADKLFEKTGAVVVLKGASTIVRSKEGFFINPTGNPGLSSAGTGDVLAGMIGGLLAQGAGAAKAACAAAYLHGLTADVITSRRAESGLLAGDILAAIPKTVFDLRKRRAVK